MIWEQEKSEDVEKCGEEPAEGKLSNILFLDEVSIWSAPFGLRLLETIQIRRGLRVLDVGPGLGFPMLHIAELIRGSGTVVGIDPWKEGNAIVTDKIKAFHIDNAEIVEASAIDLPSLFPEPEFDLVVSNNGITNCSSVASAVHAISAVTKPGGQFVFTFNGDRTLLSFYNSWKELSVLSNRPDIVAAIDSHIRKKRPPIDIVREWLDESGFDVKSVLLEEDGFRIQYASANALFHSHFVQIAFVPAWKKVLHECGHEESEYDALFESICERMDFHVGDGVVTLEVPIVTVDCVKRASV